MVEPMAREEEQGLRGRFPKLRHIQLTAEQNGCRQRLEGYLSCQQRLPLAVA